MLLLKVKRHNIFRLHEAHPAVTGIRGEVGTEDIAGQEIDGPSYGDAVEADVGPDEHRRARPLPPTLPAIIIVTREGKHMAHLLEG